MPWPMLQRLRSKGLSWQDYRRLRALNRRFARVAPPARGAAVWFFNASARLWGLSQNAAFQWLTAWSLRLRGVPVRQWVCQAGLPRCVLAAAQDEGRGAPPCAMCQAQSARLYPSGLWDVSPIHASPDPAFTRAIADQPLDALLQFTWADLPLGELITPSLRWALRRHNLPDTPATRALARAFLIGAWNVARAVQARLDHERPRAAVVFNGQFYPEATLAYLTRRAGIPTITHEVGLRPLTAFFTHGEATAYPIELPDDFALLPQQEARLNAYLSRRFQGDFTMAGIRFWPDMRGLDEAFLAKAARFRALVPIFTNVVFDTSQKHANVLFPHMFAWLDGLRAVIREHPEVLFVLRAHPDEQRPGKAARESVRAWVQQHQIHTWPNVHFVDAQEYVSSYELIRRAKFVLIYNSTIGLEAVLLGKPVLAAGAARFTRYPIVYLPDSAAAYWRTLRAFLAADEVPLPESYRRNAQRFLYFQLYRVSLPFGRWLEPHPLVRGYVRLRDMPPEALHPDASPTMAVLHEGILRGQPFVLPEDATDDAA